MSNMLCRLCDSETVERFRLLVIGRHEVGYHQCSGCGSLQIDSPFWLDEAYAFSNLAVGDVGAAQRTIRNQAILLVMQRFLKFSRVLDFGGGDGLLCRLLRDRGVDAYTTDEYTSARYAQTFEAPLGPGYDVVTAFEVLEHLPVPAQILRRIFEATPNYFIASTELYSDQGPEWWYLVPQFGQHVFFYSQSALQHIAQRYGYALYHVAGLHLFSRSPIPAIKIRLLRRATSGIVFRLFRARLMFSETWDWITRDFNAVTVPSSPVSSSPNLPSAGLEDRGHLLS